MIKNVKSYVKSSDTAVCGVQCAVYAARHRIDVNAPHTRMCTAHVCVLHMYAYYIHTLIPRTMYDARIQ